MNRLVTHGPRVKRPADAANHNYSTSIMGSALWKCGCLIWRDRQGGKLGKALARFVQQQTAPSNARGVRSTGPGYPPSVELIAFHGPSERYPLRRLGLRLPCALEDPFSADLILWLSIAAAVRLAPRIPALGQNAELSPNRSPMPHPSRTLPATAAALKAVGRPLTPSSLQLARQADKRRFDCLAQM